MTQIIADQALRTKLLDLAQPLEICNEQGRVLARVLPVYDLAEYGPLEPQISEEEMKRREKSDKWYTTEQVLEHLKSLE